MKRAMILGLAAMATLTQAWANDASKKPEPTGLGDKEAVIPFLNQRDAILNWQANGQEGLWIQDGHKQWFYATVFTPCSGLEFAVQLGFKSRVMNRLDRDSEIIVPDNGHCRLTSLKTSGPPPKGKRHGADAVKMEPADKAEK